MILKDKKPENSESDAEDDLDKVSAIQKTLEDF